MKKAIVSLMFAMGFMAASAQEQQPKTENVFNPHWFVQAQGGAQYTLGEVSFGDLISPNVQVSGGYNFSKLFGVRLSVNAWQSKAGSIRNEQEYQWKWNYINPNADAILNLSNLIGGYKADRLFNVSAFLGLGVNVAWNNAQAASVNDQMMNNTLSGQTSNYAERGLVYLWDGTNAFFSARAGLMGDFRITENWSVGLEVNANILTDSYNSKKAGNADWHFNALVGVKYAFGKTHTTREVPPCCEPEIRYVEKIVEKVVEKPVTVDAVKVLKVEPLRRDIFFALNSTKVTEVEMQKLKEVADYLKTNTNAKVSIVGHADKGTGNAAINKRISEKRAQKVADVLVQNFGISANRIDFNALGDTEQPFTENSMNRVCICIAK